VIARRIAAALGAVVVAGVLAACAPGGGPLPVDVPPGIGAGDDPVPAGVSAACRDAFPGLAGTGDLTDVAHIVPADWPSPPLGAELCVVLDGGEGTAILQYVSPKQDAYAVLDHYEVALQDYRYEGWEFLRDEGIGGQPILYVAGPELEFAIQTDAGTATYVVGFELLTP